MEHSINGYNEYIRTIKNRMRNYNQFKIHIQNMEEEIKQKKEYLEKSLNVSAAIAQYGEKQPSGTPELNKVEQCAVDRIKAEAEIVLLENDIAETKLIIEKLKRSMSGLDVESQQIVHEYYINKRSWEQVADIMHYSPKWARTKGRKAIKDMACMIYGEKNVLPKQLSMVFM